MQEESGAKRSEVGASGGLCQEFWGQNPHQGRCRWQISSLGPRAALQLSRLTLVHLEKEGLLKTSCEELKTFSWRRVMRHRGELP